MMPIADLFNHDLEPNVVASIDRRSLLLVDVTDAISFQLTKNVRTRVYFSFVFFILFSKR